MPDDDDLLTPEDYKARKQLSHRSRVKRSDFMLRPNTDEMPDDEREKRVRLYMDRAARHENVTEGMRLDGKGE